LAFGDDDEVARLAGGENPGGLYVAECQEISVRQLDVARTKSPPIEESSVLAPEIADHPVASADVPDTSVIMRDMGIGEAKVTIVCPTDLEPREESAGSSGGVRYLAEGCLMLKHASVICRGRDRQQGAGIATVVSIKRPSSETSPKEHLFRQAICDAAHWTIRESDDWCQTKIGRLPAQFQTVSTLALRPRLPRWIGRWQLRG
jgi:hypothetical protein